MLSVSPSSLTFRQGDLLPALAFQIVREGGCCFFDGEEPIDPAAYSTWTLTLYGLTTVTVALTYNATTGLLSGAFAAGDTDIPGNYLGLLHAVETASSKPRSFPTDHEIEVEIVPLPS